MHNFLNFNPNILLYCAFMLIGGYLVNISNRPYYLNKHFKMKNIVTKYRNIIANSLFGDDAWEIYQKNKSSTRKILFSLMTVGFILYLISGVNYYYFSSASDKYKSIGIGVSSNIVTLGTFVLYTAYVNTKNHISEIRKRYTLTNFIWKKYIDLYHDLTNLITKVAEGVNELKKSPGLVLRPLPSGALFIKRLSNLEISYDRFNEQYLNMQPDGNETAYYELLNLVNQQYQLFHEIKLNVEMLVSINTLENRIKYENLGENEKINTVKAYSEVYKGSLPVLVSREKEIKNILDAFKEYNKHKLPHTFDFAIEGNF